MREAHFVFMVLYVLWWATRLYLRGVDTVYAVPVLLAMAYGGIWDGQWSFAVFAAAIVAAIYLERRPPPPRKRGGRKGVLGGMTEVFRKALARDVAASA